MVLIFLPQLPLKQYPNDPIIGYLGFGFYLHPQCTQKNSPLDRFKGIPAFRGLGSNCNTSFWGDWVFGHLGRKQSIPHLDFEALDSVRAQGLGFKDPILGGPSKPPAPFAPAFFEGGGGAYWSFDGNMWGEGNLNPPPN